MNTIYLAGEVTELPVFSHEAYGENFYDFSIGVKRASGTYDYLNCTIPESYSSMISLGMNYIKGEIRTRNVCDKERHLEIKVFVNGFYEPDGKYENIVEINGFVCKEANYRETPLGRQISYILIASNREKNSRSDYIPCIFWGRNALRISEQCIGQELCLKGRLQSREYTKRHEDGSTEIKTAYEVSVSAYKAKE